MYCEVQPVSWPSLPRLGSLSSNSPTQCCNLPSYFHTNMSEGGFLMLNSLKN